MKTILKPTAFVALLALGLVPQIRAADSGAQAQETKARIDTARTECAKIRNQIGLTLEELNRLQKPSVELRPQLDKYSAELVKMEEQAKLTRDRASTMQEKGRAYFKAWEDQITLISNQDIKEQAQKRYNQRAKSYDKITKAAGEAREELVPFMSDLKDIKTLLDSELSRGSVNSAKKLIKTANAHGKVVAESLKNVEEELDRVSAELAKYK